MTRKGTNPPRVVDIRYLPKADADARLSRAIDILMKAAARGTTNADDERCKESVAAALKILLAKDGRNDGDDHREVDRKRHIK